MDSIQRLALLRETAARKYTESVSDGHTDEASGWTVVFGFTGLTGVVVQSEVEDHKEKMEELAGVVVDACEQLIMWRHSFRASPPMG